MVLLDCLPLTARDLCWQNPFYRWIYLHVSNILNIQRLGDKHHYILFYNWIQYITWTITEQVLNYIWNDTKLFELISIIFPLWLQWFWLTVAIYFLVLWDYITCILPFALAFKGCKLLFITNTPIWYSREFNFLQIEIVKKILNYILKLVYVYIHQQKLISTIHYNPHTKTVQSTISLCPCVIYSQW